MKNKNVEKTNLDIPIFDYEDIQLIPNYCTVSSRSKCDPSVIFGPRKFRIPVVPANMTTIIDESLAKFLAEKGYFYIMHRFDFNNFEFIKQMHDLNLYASISVGVQDEHLKLIKKLAKEKLIPEYITIDIAHGHAKSMKKMIEHVKHYLPESFLIAGNVATPEAIADLENWGADATKVGIGPGKVCTTKLKTGFGTAGWQLAAINWCAKVAKKPFISDGGIRYNCDITKSIRFGASLCMIGSLFAGHDENPGDLIIIDNKLKKVFYGSASEYNKIHKKNIEGKKIHIDHKGSLNDTLKEIEEDLQSAISYSGGKYLKDIRKCDFVIVKNSILNGDI